MDEPGPKRTLGFELIVRAAAQAQVLDARLTAAGERLDVVELEPRALLAAMTRGAHERAPATVALRHRTADAGGDVAPVRVGPPGGRVPRLFPPALPANCGPEPPALELRNCQVEHAAQHLVQVARGDRVPEQRGLDVRLRMSQRQ